MHLPKLRNSELPLRLISTSVNRRCNSPGEGREKGKDTTSKLSHLAENDIFENNEEMDIQSQETLHSHKVNSHKVKAKVHFVVLGI